MIPFPDSKALVHFYTRALNSYLFSCSNRDERIAFVEVAALVDQYPIGQTGVDRGPTAKQSVQDSLGADITVKAGCGETSRHVYNMQDGNGVEVHDIHHYPLVEARILGTRGDAEASRPRLDWMAGVTALRWDVERLRRRIFRTALLSKWKSFMAGLWRNWLCSLLSCDFVNTGRSNQPI